MVSDGRSESLDGIAVGVAEPDESGTPTESPTPGETTSEDEWPFPEDEPRFDDPDTDPGAEPDRSGIFFGLILAGWGVIEFRYARPLARFEEQLDAIGSTTPVSEVEPAEWKVALTKLVGVVFALVGLYLIGQGIVMQN
ncbi:hypothetical protein [Halapricum desulfuricans]|uniref:hypothetical protein n=1 Tax=Halapricum desulfuricans TaxID=2841257 RepID=UPI001E5D6381|nr:hypothetical protein [Halapricum desulfuricans]